jgi:hypothetical protein
MAYRGTPFSVFGLRISFGFQVSGLRICRLRGPKNLLYFVVASVAQTGRTVAVGFVIWFQLVVF